MARTPKDAPQGEAAAIKARVLVECAYGKPNDVITVDADTLAALGGMVDATPEAVAYAESLAH